MPKPAERFLRRVRQRRSWLRRSVLLLASAFIALAVSGTDAFAGKGPAGRLVTATTQVTHSIADAKRITPSGLVAAQRIEVYGNSRSEGSVKVSVGIPFPPGMLRDTALVRVFDNSGAEVPAAVKPTLHWFAKDGSVRAVRVQFDTQLRGKPQTFYFSFDRPRQRQLAGWSYGTGLVDAEQGLQVPAALATLTPEWLCASLIAGPQLPASPGEPQANYVSTQFQWAQKLPVADSSAWLFDRPSTLYKAYIRTGRLDYLQAAQLSYRFYMKYIRQDGFAMSPMCAGGWTYNHKPCDVKYVYVEPILLALALTGDDSYNDAGLIGHMMSLWKIGGWSGEVEPYKAPSQYFTERLAGLGLLETVSAYELTGEERYKASIEQQVGWLRDHQQNNPDGLGNDGSWRSSWNLHENDSWQPATDVRGSSTWMSENIIDGLWHAWLATGDARIPPMITGFGRYLERYGWVSPGLLVTPHDWRNPCSGTGGLIAWYWSSAHASIKDLTRIQESEGWYSDSHNVELALPVAAARYFERDPKQGAALGQRLKQLASSYNTSCAQLSDTLRRFNWNNRGSGVVRWLEQQPAGSGVSSASPTQAKQ